MWCWNGSRITFCSLIMLEHAIMQLPWLKSLLWRLFSFKMKPICLLGALASTLCLLYFHSHFLYSLHALYAQAIYSMWFPKTTVFLMHLLSLFLPSLLHRTNSLYRFMTQLKWRLFWKVLPWFSSSRIQCAPTGYTLRPCLAYLPLQEASLTNDLAVFLWNPWAHWCHGHISHRPYLVNTECDETKADPRWET